MTTDGIWMQYAEQLIGAVTSGAFDAANQAFSLAGSNCYQDLGNTNQQIANNYIYNLGNTVPANSISYSARSNLSRVYYDFLQHIDLGGDLNPNLDALIAEAQTDFQAANDNFLTVAKAAADSYKTFIALPGEGNISFTDYCTQYYPAYGEALNDMTAKKSRLDALKNQKYGPAYNEIVIDSNNAGPQTGALNPTSQDIFNMPSATENNSNNTPTPPATIYVPAFSLNGFKEKYKEWQEASVAKKLTGGSITITGASGQTNLSDLGWDASADSSFDYGFFSIGASGSVQSRTFSFDETSSNFSFSIVFTGFGSFTINPTQWFDLGVVNSYYNHLMESSPDYFSDNGTLRLLPSAIVLGFQPQIKLSLENSDYFDFKKTVQASGGAALHIGPFTIGGSGSYYDTQENMNFDDTSYSVTVGPCETTEPVLLGVISSKMGQ